jgi:exosortase
MTSVSIPGAKSALGLRSAPTWVLLAGAAALGLPTMATLADGAWTQDTGAHGPIVLATSAWLLWRERALIKAEAKPGSLILALPLLFLSLAIYVFGRAYDFDTLEAGGLYAAGLSIAYAAIGVRLMARLWFPLFYLAFAVPPPRLWMDIATAPLKQFVSFASTGVLHGVGLPVAREGVTIFVAQYQLLVEDACSGMNSLIGLSAVSLLYVYLRRQSSVGYTALLIAFVLPIAVLVNVLRIMTLVLLTYFFGDGVAQGFLHMTTGMVLFGLALVLVFALDAALAGILARIPVRRRTPA